MLYQDAGKTFVYTGTSAGSIYLSNSTENTDALNGMQVDIIVTGSGIVTLYPNGATVNGSTANIVIPQYSKKTLMRIDYTASWALL